MRASIGSTALAVSFVLLGNAQPDSTPVRLYCERGLLSVEKEWAEDSLIVTGTAEALTEIKGADGLLERTVYRFRVARAYRGSPTSTVDVYSDNDSGRFPMQRGESYLLFLSRWEDGYLHVDNCGNSRPLPHAADVIRRLRALARPRSES